MAAMDDLQDAAPPPMGPWKGGLILSSSAWPEAVANTPPTRYITRSAPGDLSPASSAFAWNLLIGLPTDAQAETRIRRYTDGLDLVHRTSQHTVRGDVMILPEGSLIGRIAGECKPELLSVECDAHSAPDHIWLDHNGDQVVLCHQQAGDADTWFFALSYSSQGDLSALVRRARELLDHDPGGRIDKHRETRRRIWEKGPREPMDAAAAHAAAEILIGALRPPTGEIPFRWCAREDDQGREGFDLNLAAAILPAWLDLAPDVALELVRSALSVQQPDGRLPAFAYPDGTVSPYWAWPLWASRAEDVFTVLESPDDRAGCLSRLRSGLHAFFQQRRLHPTDWLGWERPEEALIGDTLDHELATVDIAALALEDADACERLGALSSAPPDEDLIRLANIARDQLNTLHWDTEQTAYLDAYADGRQVNRATLGTLMPLAVSTLPADRRRSLTERMNSRKLLRGDNGIQLWQSWSDDPIDPPIPALHQLLLLHALRRPEDAPVLADLARQWWTTLASQHRLYGRYSRNLDNPPSTSGDHDTAEPIAEEHAAVDSAALAWTSIRTLLQRSRQRQMNPALRRLEQYRLLVVGVPLAALAVAVVVLTLIFQYKPVPPRSTLQSMTGLAEQHYAVGEYQAAADLLKKVIDARGAHPQLLVLLGNAQFRLGDYDGAVESYRRAIKTRNQPQLHYNLAIALFRSGEIQPAKDELRQLLEKYPNLSRSFRSRIRDALDLLEGKDILVY